MKKNKHLLAILGLVILTACNEKNITFNGFGKGTLKYRTNITLKKGLGTEGSWVLAEKKINRSYHQIDWEINIKDTTTCEVTVLRIRNEVKVAGMFTNIFDTDIDTVTSKSIFGETEYEEEKNKLVIKDLETLKRLCGKSFTIVRNNNKKLQLEKTIDLDDYKFELGIETPEAFINEFFKPENLLTLFDFVFYPELGTFQKDSVYQKESLGRFRYRKDDKVTYWENIEDKTTNFSVHSTIDNKNNQLIESIFYKKKMEDNEHNPYSGLKTLNVEEITVQPLK